MTVLHEVSRNDDEVTPSAARVATLAALIDTIGATSRLSPKRRADMCSAIRTLARATGLQLESTPCDPRILTERLRFISAATARMSTRRFANCKSLVDAAFAYADRRFGRRRNRTEIAPVYASLLKRVPDTWDRLPLRRLFHFVAEQGLSPGQIDGQVFQEFERRLEHSTIKDPRTFGRIARQVWNRACAEAPEWPGKPVAVPSYVDHWVLPKESFPASLWTELDAYLAMRMKKGTLAIDDLLTEDELFGAGEIMQVPSIRASTAALVGYRVRQFASGLVLAGHVAAEAITALKVLVAPATVNAGLKVFVQRAGGARNSQIRGIASDLKMIAKHWVKSPRAELDKLDLLVSRTRPKHEGLPPSARRSIAVFSDAVNVRAFLQLPETIVAEAERAAKIDRKIANEVAAALWMKIAQRAPLRINNLLHTKLEANILRSHAGKGASVTPFYPQEEVKNDKALEIPMAAATVKMLELYLKKYRSALVDGPCPWLFPAQDGGPKLASVMSADIQRMMLKRLGFRINPHSFRHVAARLYLSAHPGDYETVQRILGHKKRDTTVKYYVDLQAEQAFRHFDNVLLRLVDRESREKI